MPVPVIVIEIAAQKPAPEHLPTLLEACNRSALGARCVIDAEPDTRPDAVAIVRWEDRDSVRIEVGVRRGEQNDWRTKDFAFSASYELGERWRAVGFAIGTLASDQRREEAEEPPEVTPPESETKPKQEAEPSRKQTPERPKARARKRSAIWLDAGALLGPGIQDRSLRIGGLLGSAWSPAGSPLYLTLMVSAAFEAEQAEDAELDARFIDVGIGLGYRLLVGEKAGLALSAEGVLEEFAVRVSAASASDAQQRWLFGGRLALVGDYRFTQEIGAFLMVNAGAFGGATDIRIYDKSFGTVGELRYALCAGLRLKLR